jgi:glutaredoxin
MYTIIGRWDCIWCDKAAKLLEIKNEVYKYYLYHDHPLTKLLMKVAKLNTLPQIWDGDHYIGGYAELEVYLKDKESKL